MNALCTATFSHETKEAEDKISFLFRQQRVSKSIGKEFKVMQQKNFCSVELADKKQCAAHNTSEIWIKTARDIGCRDEHCSAKGVHHW